MPKAKIILAAFLAPVPEHSLIARPHFLTRIVPLLEQVSCCGALASAFEAIGTRLADAGTTVATAFNDFGKPHP